MKILIIEDEKMLALLMKKGLEENSLPLISRMTAKKGCTWQKPILTMPCCWI